MRRLLSLTVGLTISGTGRLAAQASPFLSPGDPRAAMLEHLIARGAMPDPDPLERPWRVAPWAAALEKSADPWARALLASFRGHSGNTVTGFARGGVQAYTQGRRDLLREGGSDGVTPYAEAGGSVARGPLILAVHGAVENRIKSDPEWRTPARIAERSVVVRAVEAYGGLEFSWGTLLFGQRLRNWGPAGVPGIAIADPGYPRPDLELGLRYRWIAFTGIVTRMAYVTAPGSGEPVERYFVAHRLTITPSRALTLTAWETAVIAGRADELDGTTRAIVPLLFIPAVRASRVHRNEMVGGQISWRPAAGLRLEGEIAIDDWNFDDSNPYPQRWAATFSGGGSLGRTLSWQATWTTASSLAFHTLTPEENFTDGGVGIAKLFPDHEEIAVRVGVPVAPGWLVSPRLALLRQGEGRLTDPFPSFEEASEIPDRFIGTVARSLWAGAGISGWRGPLRLVGEAGIRHLRNAEHQPGLTRTSLEARLTATIGLTLTRPIR